MDILNIYVNFKLNWFKIYIYIYNEGEFNIIIPSFWFRIIITKDK